MIITEVDYLDGEFTTTEKEPSTIPELREMIGEEGVIENVNSNLRYRNKYPRVYKRVSQEVIKLGFERRVKKEELNKDGTVKKILVSDMDHLREFLAKDEMENRPVLQALFDRIANEEPLYVKGERVGGGGRIAQGALDAANKYFAKGDDEVDRVVLTIEERIPGFKVARDGENNVTPESVARGIQALQRYLMQQAKKATKIALG
jgi:hypothetical protein